MPIDVSQAAEEILDEVAVCQPGDDDRGGPLRLLVGAVGHALGPLATWVRDTDDGPGWSILVDPDRTPSPRWTGQLNGVVVTQGASDAQQREELHNAAGLRRGGSEAMRGAMATTLTGSKLTTVYERVGSAYRLIAISYASQTPDPAATEKAALSQKPAGLLLEYRVDPGWSVGQLEAEYALPDDVADVEATFATVNDVETRLPNA